MKRLRFQLDIGTIMVATAAAAVLMGVAVAVNSRVVLPLVPIAWYAVAVRHSYVQARKVGGDPTDEWTRKLGRTFEVGAAVLRGLLVLSSLVASLFDW